MRNFRDDETLTDNLDDGLAGRVFHFLETIETVDPSKLDFWIYIMKFWNGICQEGEHIDLFTKIMSILEERYVQEKK